MSDTAKGLVGRVVVATGEGRDLYNQFCLVISETETSLVLIPLQTDSEPSKDPEWSAWGSEVPRTPPDPAAALAACAQPLVAERGTGATVCSSGEWAFELWDGQPRPYRSL